MRRSSSAVAGLAALLLCLAVFPGTSRAALPCGIATPVDRILDCDREPGAASAQSDTGSEPRAAAPRFAAVPRSRGLTAAERDPTRLLARFRLGTTKARAATVIKRAGGELERRIAALGVDVVRTEPARLTQVAAELERSPLVLSLENEQLVAATAVEPNDPGWVDQGGLRVARFEEAWLVSRGSADVVVAVLDTGISAHHPDLAGAVLPGQDIVNSDSDASDDHGHGTAVAGVIAARANNGQGIAGVCWSCRLLPVKVLGANGYGPTSAVAAGIVWAADHGADVINLSLGSPTTTDTLAAAVRYADERGALIVAAAGNAGLSSPFYPAAEQHVLAVAATDEHDRPYEWTNRGSWVALAAPGCTTTTALGGDYAFECGTSFAAPIVAGLSALALSVQPTMTAEEIATAARRAATPIGSVVANGRVDAARTLALLPTKPRTVTKSVVIRGSLGASRRPRTYAIVTTGGAVRVRLVRNKRQTATLELLTPTGERLARDQGRTPLRLSANVPAGTYRLRIHGPRGPYTLTAEYLGIESSRHR